MHPLNNIISHNNIQFIVGSDTSSVHYNVGKLLYYLYCSRRLLVQQATCCSPPVSEWLLWLASPVVGESLMGIDP